MMAKKYLGVGALAALMMFARAPAEDTSIGLQQRHIYPTIEAAPADLEAAIAQAHREHKRVIVDFGGDWCPDCQVLNLYFQREPNSQLLARYYVRVNVNIGRLDANKDIAARFGVPLKGVPALAVLDGDGKVIYAQNQEFADMRHLDADALSEFLNKWKG
jgi:thioredoxin 1